MSPDRPKEFTYFIRIYFTYDDMVSIPCFELKERYTEAESKDYGGYIRALFFNSTKFSVGLATRLTKPAITQKRNGIWLSIESFFGQNNYEVNTYDPQSFLIGVEDVVLVSYVKGTYWNSI